MMSGGWGTPTWMTPGPDLGETFIQGKTTETARGLLEAADRAGIDRHEVRTVQGGFIVPNAVYDAWAETVNDNAEQF